MKLVSVAEMQAVERAADAEGHSYAQMMAYAGLGLAEQVQAAAAGQAHLSPTRAGPAALALVGAGNNGGDALVALAHLAQHGWRVCAYLVRPRPPADPLLDRVRDEGGEVVDEAEDPGKMQLAALLEAFPYVIDGVLGTGARLPLKPELAGCLDFVRRRLAWLRPRPFVIAVDCPSGIDCDSGDAAPETIPADLTVSMAAAKQGMFAPPAYELVGKLVVVSIGLLESGAGLDTWQALRRTVAEPQLVAGLLPPRPAFAHKGSFGTLLIAAGSVAYTGAAALAAEAAYRSGAGLVSLAAPLPLHAALAGRLPEITWLPLPAGADGFLDAQGAALLLENLGRASALLVGPGFGQSAGPAGFIAQLFAEGRAKRLPPLVVDADGLKLLASLPDWPARLPAPAVLTPHPGEMSALTGRPVAEIQANRLETAVHYSQAWQHVVILKGALSVVAAPDGQATLIPVATPALARAGTGDVLAGLVGGLRAQGMEAYPAAVAGAWIHAQAGLLAAERFGHTAPVLASDVLTAVPAVLAALVD